MKKNIQNLKFLFFIAIVIVSLSSCKDEVVKTFTYHTQTPYYLSVADIRQMVVAEETPRAIAAPGKIYIYNDFLFVSEPNKGIHIIDNNNPAKPQFISFINIPGTADLAINNNVLYADSYIDLLAFDITNPRDVKLVKRVEDVFENLYINKEKGMVLGYKDTIITYTQNSGDIYHNGRGEMFTLTNSFSSNAKASYGTGGSTAKFTLQNSSLYTVDNNSLKTFNVSDEKNPAFVKTINLGFGIETIFPYNDKLFIGSTTGMHIYDASNPLSPKKLSIYQHVTSCDPVVVQGKYAYVTLRSGNFCRQGVNLLEVIDIEDATKPKLISSFPMINPHGLSIDGGNLYICEGLSGLKAFDSSNIYNIGQKQLSFIKGFEAIDVIAGPKSLIVTGKDGVYQFDYSNPANLIQLSRINIDSDYQ
ncbi:LVIVD repeat-containing protein [Pedobacter alpinus]|uniref:LVIVD repeat-containing protein n=1 Tax=Pedobacter alpinus TaxID=1590643 RepID=A0ABW5TMD6_9SPHI